MSENATDRAAKVSVPLTNDPEMGCSTAAVGNAPFSLRLPPDLRKKISARAESNNVSVGYYIRTLVEAELTGKPVRRRRSKFDGLRQDLAQVHGTIIKVGNRIAENDRDAVTQIEQLKDAVAILVEIARSLGIP